MPRNGKKTFSFSFFLSLSSTIFRIRREIYLAPPDFLFFSQTWKSLNPHCEQETRSLFFNPFFVQRGFYIRIYINISIYNNIIIDIKNLDILLTGIVINNFLQIWKKIFPKILRFKKNLTNFFTIERILVFKKPRSLKKSEKNLLHVYCP